MGRVKARLTICSDVHARIDFSTFIPAVTDVPLRANPSRSPFERESFDTRRLARRVARRNYGQSPVELSNAVKTHDDLLKSLLCLPGLVEIAQVNPYSIHFKCGTLFDPFEMAQKIVKLILKHFYPEEEATWMETVHEKEQTLDF